MLLNKCLICETEKSEESFHQWKLNFNQKSYSEKILPYCLDCVQETIFEYDKEKNEPILPANTFKNLYNNKQYEKLYQTRGYLKENLVLQADLEKLFGRNKNEIRKHANIMNIPRILVKLKGRETEYTRSYYPKESIPLFELSFKHNYCFLQCTSRNNNEIFIPDNKEKFLSTSGYKYILVNHNSNEKICTCCFIKKPLEEFCRHYKYKNNRSYRCLDCARKEGVQRYAKMTEEERQAQVQKSSEYQKNNPDKKIECYKKAIQNPLHKVQANLRKSLTKTVQNMVKDAQLKIQKPHTTIKQIGCSKEELKVYIESKFQPGMTWENYGPGYEIENGKPKRDVRGNIILKKQWHMDHVRPVSDFDFTKVESLFEVNHYTNLQPLWAEDNLRKQAKVDESLQLTNARTYLDIYENKLKTKFIEAITEINIYMSSNYYGVIKDKNIPLLDITRQQLKEFIESKFQQDMSWNNLYGNILTNGQITLKRDDNEQCFWTVKYNRPENLNFKNKKQLKEQITYKNFTVEWIQNDKTM